MEKTRTGRKEEEFEYVPDELVIWKPSKVNETLIGLVMVRRPGQYGDLMQLQTADGDMLYLPAHKTLQSRLESVPGGIIPGQTVLKVVYLGEKKSGKGQPMRLYKVGYRKFAGPEDIF